MLGSCPEGFSRKVPDLSRGVAKSNLFPQILVVLRGRIARVLVVKVLTCLVKVFTSLSCSSDFIGGEHLFNLLERCGVGWCVGRRDIHCWTVEIGVASSVERSLQDVSIVIRHI